MIRSKNCTYCFDTTRTALNALVLILITLPLLISCDEKDENPKPSVYEYYPFSIGQFSIFQINEVVYSAGQKDSLVSAWQEKDEVVSSTTDSHGMTTYIVSRSRRASPVDNWQKLKEFSVQKYPDKIVLNLDGELTVPMIFPVDLNVKWNQFMYFNLHEQDYRYGYDSEYKDIGRPYTASDSTFDNTVKVQERLDTTGLTQYHLAIKHYASGVGLVSDQAADFEYLQNNGQLEGDKIIASGKRRTRLLIGHGH